MIKSDKNQTSCHKGGYTPLQKNGKLGMFNFDFLEDEGLAETPEYALYVHNQISVIIITFQSSSQNIKYVLDNEKFSVKYRPEGGARMSSQTNVINNSVFNESNLLVTDLKTNGEVEKPSNIRYVDCRVDYELFKDSFSIDFDEEEEWRQMIYTNMNNTVRFLRRRRKNALKKEKEGAA